MKIQTQPQRNSFTHIKNLSASEIFNFIKFDSYVPFIPLHIDQLFDDIDEKITLP